MSFDQTNNHTHLRNVNSSLTVEVDGINPHELSSHTVKTFEKLRLNSQLLNGIYEMGFRSTSCLEEHALPQSLANPPRNLIVQSPNGTGKKVTCSLSILHRINPNFSHVQALILSPTLEIALQIGSTIKDMAKHLPYIQIEYAVRDRNLSKPNEYKKGKRLIDIPIVIGTPGTVEDWARKLKIIDLKKLDMFVIIDEASSLINTGNFSQICFDLVKNRLRKDCQTMFFTSTYSNEVATFAKEIIENFVLLRLESKHSNIRQFFIECKNNKEKLNAINMINQLIRTEQSVIFCNDQKLAKTLELRMKNDKRLIVTTICPCQIDTNKVSLVFNFQFPFLNGRPDYDAYSYRVELVERSGRIGYVFNLVDSLLEKSLLKKVETYFQNPITEFSSQIYADYVDQPFELGTTTVNNSSSAEFQDFNLKPKLLKGILDMGFQSPSKIQAIALPHLLANPPRNVIAQSPSGTGKTVAFALAILSRINPWIQSPQALILVPTRELVIQIGSVIEKLAQFLPFIKIAYAVPNSSISEKLNPSRSQFLTTPIVIGTPRTVERWCFQYCGINLNKLKIFCVDEADHMISTDDFKRTLKDILHLLHRSHCQIMLFSATYSDQTMAFARQFLLNPVILRDKSALHNIRQFFIRCTDKEKYHTIEHMYAQLTIGQTMIFCQTKAIGLDLVVKMEQQKHSVKEIMSILDAEQREATIRKFREGIFRVLIATNIAARGLDVADVTLVINYDMPVTRTGQPDYETYLHRIGRCGRFGKPGYAFNLINLEKEYNIMKSIENHFNFNIKEITIEEIGDLESDE